MKIKQTILADAVVIGTGAAGYNAACRIRQLSDKHVVIVTEEVNCGTSRNTGSDKQTYYKLGLCGDQPDSIRAMAEDLFAGGSMDGDQAYCEAALSARCFLNLCELGVPFPTNRYGEFVGYKTDHDPRARATSVGPLTSKFMTEALQQRAQELNIPVYSGLLAIEVLKDGDRCCGILCLEIDTGDFVAFHTDDVVLATGGPAGIYADSVYPECHTGSSGLALSAGAKMQNLTEWQYGLASIFPRWNVSGTYMQVLPRFVSVDTEGNEYEFLLDFFNDPYEALNAVFLKGYQWPFDSKKVLSGSSVIDLLVYQEKVFKNRRVYLDYTHNPFNLKEIDYTCLCDEVFTYLDNAGACFGTPIQRLNHMNRPAVDLYASKGLDIEHNYLEIALCAQHHNGGIAVDLWWRTSVEGLYAVGECAGTHGIARPGGSALNAGQVGSLRAAQWISAKTANYHTSKDHFDAILKAALSRNMLFCNSVIGECDNCDLLIHSARRRMSDYGAALRNPSSIKQTLAVIEADLRQFDSLVKIPSGNVLHKVYRLKDILLVQQAVLTAMLDYSQTVKLTRGSSLYYNENGTLRDGLIEPFRFIPGDYVFADQVQELFMETNAIKTNWRNVRPLPQDDTFFENVWRTYRQNKNIY